MSTDLSGLRKVWTRSFKTFPPGVPLVNATCHHELPDSSHGKVLTPHSPTFAYGSGGEARSDASPHSFRNELGMPHA